MTNKNRYQKVYDVALSLRDKLRDGGRNYGHFEHILNNLAFIKPELLEGERKATPSERKSFRQKVRAVRTYRKLLEAHPEFREAELGVGYFNSDERKPVNAEGNKRTIFNAIEYVEYAKKMLN